MFWSSRTHFLLVMITSYFEHLVEWTLAFLFFLHSAYVHNYTNILLITWNVLNKRGMTKISISPPPSRASTRLICLVFIPKNQPEYTSFFSPNPWNIKVVDPTAQFQHTQQKLATSCRQELMQQKIEQNRSLKRTVIELESKLALAIQGVWSMIFFIQQF